MTSLKINKIIKGLQQKGFVPIDNDHTRLVLYVNNMKTRIWTMVSHGKGKEIDDFLIGKMAKQVELDNKQQFLDLVECKMTRDQYILSLTSKGFKFDGL